MANSRKTRKTGKRFGRMLNPDDNKINEDENDFDVDEDGYDDASSLSERFHGRSPVESFTVTEKDKYATNLAKLGDLIELNIFVEGQGRKSNSVIPIVFKDQVENGTPVNLAGLGNQLYIVGGDQSLSLEDLEQIGALNGQQIDGSKQDVMIGEIFSVVYFTDKHHLTGPKAQKKGTEYEHQFGEQGEGLLPWLKYDTKNEKLSIVGGSYEIRDTGIWG